MICLSNAGYDASLERRKVYAALPDADAAREGQLRVIDESGEDYLYPTVLFAPITLTGRTRKAVLESV